MATFSKEKILVDFTETELENEVQRLYSKLSHIGYSYKGCKDIAAYTLKINLLKKLHNFKILAHSYQTPDILFGVADVVGDSLSLAKAATKLDGSIFLCGVDFMAETAKILNPSKKVAVPTKGAGCTLADSITAKDVKKLKKEHPNVPVICYVNTTAEVKAESDICCTSGNVLKILEALGADKIIFIPDKNMGENISKLTGIEVITWEGYCRTHNQLKLTENVKKILDADDIISMAHLECRGEIIEKSTKIGGTGGMEKLIAESKPGDKIYFATEQGFIDRMKVENPHLELIDSHMICPMMKRHSLISIANAFENLSEENIIELNEEIRKKAYTAVKRMLEY